MTNPTTLDTKRLRLRQWKDSDLAVFAKMNADPAVMKYYPATLSEHDSHALAGKLKALISLQSWGLWAVEIKASGEFIGFVGLNKPTYDLPVTPCVEIGWRLATSFWGEGYATEAAIEVLNFAFKILNLPEVYSFTSVINLPSRAVMERLNMINVNRNFNHPIIPNNHVLKEHVLYKVTAHQWISKAGE